MDIDKIGESYQENANAPLFPKIGGNPQISLLKLAALVSDSPHPFPEGEGTICFPFPEGEGTTML